MKKLVLFMFLILSLPIAQASDLNLKGKAVLVTGASSGIGRSIAESLASQGAFVYAGARKQKDIDALSRIKNMLGIRLDVTKSEDIADAVALIKQQGRGLYGLVNNAGVFFPVPMIEVSEQELQFMMNVNVFGPYRVTKAFAPLIIESAGRITTIGSISGFVSGSMFGPYSMSKHAIEAFTDALSGEMKKFDVQVSVVEPGNFNSNIMQNMHKRLARMENQEFDSLYQDEYKRMAGFTEPDRSKHRDPIVVAKAVVHALFSASPKPRYLVAPAQGEADFVLTNVLQKVVQLNQAHEHSLDKKALFSILDGLMK